MISLIKSIPLISKLCLFALTFLTFLGLFPMKYLKGEMYYCDIDSSLL